MSAVVANVCEAFDLIMPEKKTDLHGGAKPTAGGGWRRRVNATPKRTALPTLYLWGPYIRGS